MSSLINLYLFNLLLILPLNDFYKILVVSRLAVKSHVLLGCAYVDTLLEAGHEVKKYGTVLEKPRNDVNGMTLHYGPVTWFLTMSPSEWMWDDLVKRRKREERILETHGQKYFAHVVKNTLISILQHKNVYNLLQNTSQRFDLVIAEWAYGEAFSGFAVLYDCPLIWYSAMITHWTVLQRIEEATNPASTRNSFAISQNVPPFASAFILNNMYLYNLEKEIFKTTFEPPMTSRGKVLCSYEDTRYFNSLVLVNSLLLLDEDITLPEKFKPIAGLHIGRKIKPLTKELKNILDNARKGVIYFSMGTVLKSQYVPVTLKLIDVFRKLKQIVIWNTEAIFSDLPSNVHTLKWAPQQSILSHPNCILFITHGGLFSMTEAVHFGVPIIGIPAFGDQFDYVESAVNKGFGIYVDLSHSISNDVHDAILTILSNPRYRKKAKELSFIYNVRRLPPRVELNNWVKLVIRTGVSLPIRSPTANVPLYKKMYLDLAIIIFIVVALIKFIIIRSLSALCSSKQKDEYKTCG